METLVCIFSGTNFLNYWLCYTGCPKNHDSLWIVLNVLITSNEVYERRNSKGSIFNESGIWRFRELLNFCQIDTESIEECSKFLVSLDGAEGRQSKPYQMSKAAEFLGRNTEGLWLQPEGYNPSGSFKDNGMVTAVTHAKIRGQRPQQPPFTKP